MAARKTKQTLAAILVVTALTLTGTRATAPTLPETTVPVIVDKHLAGSALVRGGVAYLPLRSVAKYLGLKVKYNADAQIILIETPSGHVRGMDDPASH